MLGQNDKNGLKENMRPENFSDRIVQHRLRRFFRVILILALIAGIAGVFWVQQKQRTYTGYVTVHSSKREISSSAKSVVLGNDILSYSKDGVNCCDTGGKTLWNETYEMQNPILAVCNSTAAIGDYNGGKIYVMNREGAMGEITTNLPIRALCVSDDGVVAAVLDDTDVTWIYLYNAKGATLAYFKTTMSQSGYPASISISPNSRLVVVSYVQADTGKVKSGVAFYNFGDVGQNEVDNYMSGYDYADTVVPYVQFMNSEDAFAVADNRLMFFEGAQKPVSKAEKLLDKEVQSVYFNSKYVALVTYDSSGKNKYLLTVYDTGGNVKLQKGFDLEYKNLVLSNDNIYIYSDSQCLIYNLYGVKKFSGTLNQTISLLIPGSGINRMDIVSQSAITKVQLK